MGKARGYALVHLIKVRGSGSPCEPLHNFYQLTMRGAGWIAELIDRMRVGEPAQAGELADALPPCSAAARTPIRL